MRSIVMALAVIVLSCGSPRVDVPVCAARAEPARVVVPASVPVDAKCGEELGWMHDGDRLRLQVRMTESGHGGFYEASAYFDRWSDEESHALVVVTYRRHYGTVFTDAQELKVKRAEIDVLLAVLRMAAARAWASPAPGDVWIEDSSRTTRMAIDVADDEHRATFEVDDAQVEPPSWRLRGCAHAFPRAAQEPVVAGVSAMTAKLGIPTMLDGLRQRAMP